jgi:hypothetical protein
MAEIEIGVLSRQCLNRRIPALEQMRAEVKAWAAARNEKKAAAYADARIKLRHLYPLI